MGKRLLTAGIAQNTLIYLGGKNAKTFNVKSGGTYMNHYGLKS
jgi:hypothetical protein